MVRQRLQQRGVGSLQRLLNASVIVAEDFEHLVDQRIHLAQIAEPATPACAPADAQRIRAIPIRQPAMPLDRLTDLTSSLKLRITAGFIGSLVLAVGVIALLLVNRAERDTLQDETRRELSASVRTASQLSRVMVEM